MSEITPRRLYEWCRIPYRELEGHPNLRTRFRLCADSAEMGRLMARELVDEIRSHNAKRETTRAIIPCGPSCWYKPFTDLVNEERVSLRDFVVFHMDECLDWQGRELARKHPYSFRGFMEEFFTGQWLPTLPFRRKTATGWTPATSTRSGRRSGRPDRHYLWRMGTGRTHRVQPGAPASIQPRDDRRRAQLHDQDSGQQHRHHYCPGPANLRVSLSVRTADVGYTRCE